MDRPPPLPPWAEELRRDDSGRYLALLFAPSERRSALLALAAFDRELALSAVRTREPMMARIRLQWWRDGVAALYGEGEVPPHPLLAALAEAIGRFRLDRGPLDALIDGREARIDAPATPADLTALRGEVESVARPYAHAALALLGAESEADRDAAFLVETGAALVRALVHLPELAARGRIPLPADRLAAHGVRVGDLVAGRPAPGLAAVVAEVATVAAEALRTARVLKPRVSRPALPELLPAVLADLRLKGLVRAGHDAYAAAVRAPRPFAPARMAWAAAWGRY